MTTSFLLCKLNVKLFSRELSIFVDTKSSVLYEGKDEREFTFDYFKVIKKTKKAAV